MYTIRKHADFVKVATDGVCVRTDFFLLRARRNSDRCRVGFTASKRVGNAVVRNRCKRRMRALASLFLSSGCVGADYVLVARGSLFSAKWSELVSSAERAFASIQKKLHACG